MRTALVSDIHGNAIALEAVLADLQRDPVDQVVCLGDALQGGSQPAEVAAQLRALGWPVVLGNADAFLLDPDAGVEAPTELQLDVRAWTCEQLGSDGMAFIETFEPTLRVPLGGDRELLAFHGSPTSYDDIILPLLARDEFRRLLGPPRADVMAGGHVHQQFLRRYGDTVFVNPGSVGLSYEYAETDDLRIDSFAAYARIESGDDYLEIAFRRVPFDRDAVLASIESSGIAHAEARAQMWR